MGESRIRYPGATRDDAQDKLHLVIYKEDVNIIGNDIGPWFIDTKDDEGGFGHLTHDFPTWEDAMAAVPDFFYLVMTHNFYHELLSLME